MQHLRLVDSEHCRLSRSLYFRNALFGEERPLFWTPWYLVQGEQGLA